MATEKKTEATQKTYPVYSELLKKPFNTVKELETAEAEFKKDLNQKAPAKQPTDRQLAADKVTKAIRDYIAFKNEMKESYSRIDEKESGACDELQKQIEALEAQIREFHEECNKQRREVDKRINEKEKEARMQLNEFCSKYGAFHYSYNGADDELYPVLKDMIGMDTIKSLFDPWFNWFGFRF